MLCPWCVSPTTVKETRLRADGVVRRRRTCSSCAQRFTTWEDVGRGESTSEPPRWDVLSVSRETSPPLEREGTL